MPFGIFISFHSSYTFDSLKITRLQVLNVHSQTQGEILVIGGSGRDIAEHYKYEDGLMVCTQKQP